MFRFFLPTAAELVRQAARCRHAVLLWVCDTSLVLRATAGQLAVLALVEEGHRLTDTLAEEHPTIQSVRRALQGEVVPYTAVLDGRPWVATVAPCYLGSRIIGAIGNAFFADASPHATPSAIQPHVYAALENREDVRVGDIVTVRTRGSGAIRLHRTLSPRRLDVLLATGVLMPVADDHAWSADERSAARAAAPDGAPPRARLRLLRG